MMPSAAGLDGVRIGVLTAWASRAGGGVFEAVAQHVGMIRQMGGEPVVFALHEPFSKADAPRLGPCEIHHLPVLGPGRIGFAPGLTGALLAARLDCLHLHGIWMYPSRAATQWARRTGKPCVISPHGMLDRWIVARGRIKKAIARTSYERASWREASVLHALTAREAGDIVREAGRSDSMVIPNAGPTAQTPDSRPRAAEFFYIGRIHPKKNLLALVAAWKLCADAVARHGARLTIAGWGDEADVATLRAALRDAPAAQYIGPCYGADKAARLRGARFVVLPSLSEGLPVAMLEAWAAATPCLMTEECNLPEGFAAGAAVDCGYAAPAIADALRRALAMNDSEWQAMSRAAHDLAAGPFAADTVARQWAEGYRALLENRR